jgi:hypothetical protein
MRRRRRPSCHIGEHCAAATVVFRSVSSLWLPFLLSCLIVCALQSAAEADSAAGPNGLHYILGGIMSGPFYMDIDFDTGRYSVRYGRRPGEATALTEQRGQLPNMSVLSLRTLAANALKMGLENDRCRQAHERGEILMPTMDALRSMAVTVDGRAGKAPERSDCWSNAAEDLFVQARKSVMADAK